jgi:hypothetical protein
LSVTLLAARLSVIICQSDGLCRAGRPAKSCVVIQDALPSPAVCLNLLRLHSLLPAFVRAPCAHAPRARALQRPAPWSSRRIADTAAGIRQNKFRRY